MDQRTKKVLTSGHLRHSLLPTFLHREGLSFPHQISIFLSYSMCRTLINYSFALLHSPRGSGDWGLGIGEALLIMREYEDDLGGFTVDIR
jgi:hypothetical protein